MRTCWKTLAVAAGIALSFSFGAGSAKAQTVDDIVKRGKVRIGVLIGAPPYGMVDNRGNPTGYDTDVANEVGKYLGVPIELVRPNPSIPHSGSRGWQDRLPRIHAGAHFRACEGRDVHDSIQRFPSRDLWKEDGQHQGLGRSKGQESWGQPRVEP